MSAAAVDGASGTPNRCFSSSGLAKSTVRPGLKLAPATPARMAAPADSRSSRCPVSRETIHRQRRAFTSTFAVRRSSAAPNQTGSVSRSDARTPARSRRASMTPSNTPPARRKSQRMARVITGYGQGA